MDTPNPAGQSPNTQPVFDPAAAHMNKPKIRSIRGFPLQAKTPDGRDMVMMGLADARQISDKVVVALPAFQVVMPLMDGSRDVAEIVAQIGKGLTIPIMQSFIAQLDDAALIEGPKFDALLAKVRKEFDSMDVLPPGATAAFADALLQNPILEEGQEPPATPPEPLPLPPEGPERDAAGAAKMKHLFDRLIAVALKDAPDPAFTALPKAIVAPHLDYPRGGLGYAAVYGRLRVADRPDRVVILGTNHFGSCTGIAACDKGYSTALGVCAADRDLVSGLRAKLGDKVFEHRFDHEREHSIELQIPWIQHVFGKDIGGNYPKVFGALVHDPVIANGASYDGNGVALQDFVDALVAVLATLPGKTLVVCSADLSHVGPAFGDQMPLLGEPGTEQAEAAQQNRDKTFAHDQEMLGLVTSNKPSELIATMAWMQNPTRWCSVGNLVAGLLIAKPSEVRLLQYAPTMDPQGIGMVTSAAIVMV